MKLLREVFVSLGGFLVAGSVWGTFVGALLIVFSIDWMFVPKVDYIGAYIIVPPVVGLMAGIALDVLIRKPENRQRVLRIVWQLLIVCALLLPFVLSAISPAL